MNRRIALLTAALLGSTGCVTHAVDPDTSRAAVRVSIKPGVLGGVASPGWGAGLPTPSSPTMTSCPHDKEQIEAALGITPVDACGSLRAGPVPQAIGNGDAPVGASYPPFCYAVGGIILVVEYEQTTTACTRVVGLSVVAKR